MRKSRFPALVLGGIAALALACGSPIPGSSPSSNSGAAVPAGEYQCYQYSASSGFLYFGKVKFSSGGQYEATPGGSGHYTMTGGGAITFTDGPYKDSEWTGQYHANDGKDFKSNTVIIDPDDLKISCHA
ncbi:MAG: hypothetical protein QOE92_2237 [Chloroflexota bacterium]|jgi:hypothetical protein|nr:hypothetical protein [Chloroflexota bacterium]